jgi:exodeoxyribonuclease V alpha subunit
MSSLLSKLKALHQRGNIGLPELEFARYLTKLKERSDMVLGAGVAAIHFHLQGHICLTINDILGYLKEKELLESNIEVLTKELSDSDLVGDGSALTPFVLEGEKLYLHRYWKYEQELSEWIRNKSQISRTLDDDEQTYINTLFEDSLDLNWQKVAVQLSRIKDLVIISGGPGTGKTYTVEKVLRSQIKFNKSSKIALAAPTGKAAQRLGESLELDTYKGQIDAPMTLHSLLGAKGVTGEFRFNRDNKLSFDVVIVDEASMLDINLWISLIRALPDKAKLILLGDKNQLASVEAGSILADICSGASNSFSGPVCEHLSNDISKDDIKPRVNDCIVELTKSYRFDESSGIKRLSEAIIAEDSDQVFEILDSPKYQDVAFKEISNESLGKLISEYAVEPFMKLHQSEFTHEGFKDNQILCALRKGPYGVEEINNRAEFEIRKKLNLPSTKKWYAGRPIMITKNNRSLKLRNGETGFAQAIERDSGFEVFFEGKEEGVIISRIPGFEPSYGITVHKSQGSEYKNVALLLSNAQNNLLTKELLYTSVTRARQTILVIGNRRILKAAVLRKIERRSGLQQKVWY